jgi:uncharacterized membrane protein
MAPRTTDRATSDGLRWIGLGLGLAAAGLAARHLIGTRHDRGAAGDASPPVSKAFTINRPPDEVALFWTELDPLGDIVEHVRFDLAPGERGTEVHVQFHAGWFGRRSPARVQERLRQFKQLVETGEIARSTPDAPPRHFGDIPEGGRLEMLLVGGAR